VDDGDTGMGKGGTNIIKFYAGGFAMVISSSLDVGIGLLNPTTKLHVAGQISGSSLDIAGTGSFEHIEKLTGTFKIPHPDPSKSDKNLVHSFVESPTSGDNLYRYRIEATLDNEQVNMDLPDYWEFLNENPQVWVSPYRMLAQCTGWVSDDLKKLHILCEKAGKYEVLLIGTRKDKDAIKHWSGVERKK